MLELLTNELTNTCRQSMPLYHAKKKNNSKKILQNIYGAISKNRI